MPIMVTKSTTPKARCDTHIQNPPSIIHNIFINTLRHPPVLGVVITSFPKGNSARNANLKVCTPKGMPIMVIIIRILETMYPMQVTMPPNISHKRFISMFINK